MLLVAFSVERAFEDFDVVLVELLRLAAHPLGLLLLGRAFGVVGTALLL